MSIETRLKKIEQMAKTGTDKVYFIDSTDKDIYKVISDGQEKQFTKSEFEKFQKDKNNTKSVFFFGERSLKD